MLMPWWYVHMFPVLGLLQNSLSLDPYQYPEPTLGGSHQSGPRLAVSTLPSDLSSLAPEW